MNASTKSPFKVQRLGVIMRPDPSREAEVEGVLNPGAARGPDGELYLFPRLVGKNNFSRIGIARVLFDGEGNPAGVERIGYALEPQEPYELRPSEGTGGCEDPRVTFVEPLGLYVMTYVAWGSAGPRIALAISENLLAWERLGIVDFQPDVEAAYGVIFNNYHNKDAAFFPEAVSLQDGTMVLGMLHRPFYDNSKNAPKGIKDPLPSIWVSGCEIEWAKRDIHFLRVMRKHALVIDPEHPWEELRIGVGTPPLRTPLGYFMLYHGVSGEIARTSGEPNRLEYVAGVLVLRRRDDKLLEYRSSTPILIPEVEEETVGTVDNVVFPTGVDDRGNGTIDVYYGMADKYVGAARVWLPTTLEYQTRDMVEVERLNRLRTS
jgi:beta-1,2-mannobiose phosphorylase / 1,2-beta-oligomannan phosphorylase